MFHKSWKQADATVIVARNFVSTAADLAGKDSKSELVLEVHPENDPPFRAEVKLSYLGVNLTQRRMTAPEVGDILRVEYDPKSHDVKVLLDEAHDRKAVAQRRDDAFQSALDAPVGSAPPVAGNVAEALQKAGLGDLLSGATVSTGRAGEINIESAPQVYVQSDGQEPVAVTSHALDPSLGGVAGIMANGVPCRATLLAVVPLPGQRTALGEDATGLVMSVTIPGQAPFQAQTGVYVPPAALARLQPGAQLVGKALPGTTDAVVIDWNAFLAG